MEPLFSICIPTYNGEAFIAETIRSVLSQDFSDYELLICDDCSVDGTVDMVKKMIVAKSNVRLIINSVNLGLVGNWNKCVSESSGQYIKFLFQDDRLLPGSLTGTADVIEKFGPSFITSKRNFILPSNVSKVTANYYNVYLQKFENELQIRKNCFVGFPQIATLVSKHIGINFIGEPSVFVFKRELFYKIGAFDASFQQLCDLEFALRAISGSELFYMSSATCDFMIHDASTTSTNISTKYFAVTYNDYIRLSAKLLYDEKYIEIRKSFTWPQRTRIKLFLGNKIYCAMNDAKIAHSDMNDLLKFLTSLGIKPVKHSVLYFIISTVLKVKNSK